MREALGSGFGVLEALKDALDPMGILNPASSASRRRVPRERGRPRRRRRHELGALEHRRARTARSRDVHQRRRPALDARARHRRGRRVGHRGRRAGDRSRRRRRGGRSRVRRHHEPARDDCRLGCRQRRVPVGPGIGWQDLRTVVDCLVLQGEGLRLAPNASATKLRVARAARRPDGLAASGRLRFGTIDTWIAWTLLARRAARHRRHQRRRDRARHCRRAGLGRPDARRRSGSMRRCCPRSSTSVGVRRCRRARCAAHRRICVDRRRPAGLARGPGLRRIRGRGSSPSGPAGCSTRSSAARPHVRARRAPRGASPSSRAAATARR